MLDTLVVQMGDAMYKNKPNILLHDILMEIVGDATNPSNKALS
jgi:hypothetical protein